MNAMEQEIERKQQALSREQSLLAQQEDEIRARRRQLHLQSLGNNVTGVSPSTSFAGPDSADISPFDSASASTVILPLATADLDITLVHEEQEMWSDRV